MPIMKMSKITAAVMVSQKENSTKSTTRGEELICLGSKTHYSHRCCEGETPMERFVAEVFRCCVIGLTSFSWLCDFKNMRSLSTFFFFL